MNDYTLDQLEDMSYRNDPMPDLRSQSDVLAFLCFRNFYDFARRAGMSPEQGKGEKSQIIEAYRINKALEELQESTSEMWKRIDIAAVEYRKAPSVEKADALMSAIYRVERKKDEHDL